MVVVDVRAKGLTTKLPAIYRAAGASSTTAPTHLRRGVAEIVLRRFSWRDGHTRCATATSSRRSPTSGGISTRCAHSPTWSSTPPTSLRTTSGAMSCHWPARRVLTQLCAIEVQSFSYLQGVPPHRQPGVRRPLPAQPILRGRACGRCPVTTRRSRSGSTPARRSSSALERIMELLLYLLPRYANELKTQLSIAFGCTGGRHRSVFVAERIGHGAARKGYEVTCSPPRQAAMEVERWCPCWS